MSGISGIYLVFALVCFAFSVAVAQELPSSTTAAAESSTTPVTPINPVSCQDAVPMTLIPIWIFGTWYEAAGKPVGGGSNTEECVEAVLRYSNLTLKATITYNSDPANLWLNQTIVKNVHEGITGSFPGEWNNTIAGVTTTYKLLDTDMSIYTLICGYVATAPTVSAGAFIFTRVRENNATQLASLTSDAVVNFKDFEGLNPVIQSEECTRGGASSTLPALTMILAVVYSILKFVH